MSQSPSTDAVPVLIIGAGAAGLWAAARCAQLGAATTVLEKTRRTGTKVLSSGGTRCNLTTTLGSDDTARCFGSGHNFIRPALKTLSPQQVRQHFESIGVQTKEEALFEKVFPKSDSAREVRDALEREARKSGVQFILESPVNSIARVGAHWTANTPAGTWKAKRMLLCTGGKSYPKTGTTGDGYPWLRDLGLKVADPVPALVPLVSPASWVHALSGISVDAEVRIGKVKRRRPVLFTHRGLSGPGAMDLSEQVTQQGHRELQLDLLPDRSWEEVRTALIEGAQQPGSPRLASLFDVPRRVLETLATQTGLTGKNPPLNQITKAQRHALVTALKAWRIPVSGSVGFSKAEVTAGGLELHQVHRHTMEVKSHPGLYVFGELLNLQGPIGGFNFQAAFATANLAAEAAVASLHSDS